MKNIEPCPQCGLEVAFEESDRFSTLCPRCDHPVGCPAPPSAKITLIPRSTPQGSNIPKIQLMTGSNTLGRQSAKSKATIQIPVQDLFMSKCHTNIAVTTDPYGNTYATVSDAGSANGTFVNEKQLLPSESTPLRNGDRLRMGNTTFEISFS